MLLKGTFSKAFELLLSLLSGVRPGFYLIRFFVVKGFNYNCYASFPFCTISIRLTSSRDARSFCSYLSCIVSYLPVFPFDNALLFIADKELLSYGYVYRFFLIPWLFDILVDVTALFLNLLFLKKGSLIACSFYWSFNSLSRVIEELGGS